MTTETKPIHLCDVTTNTGKALAAVLDMTGSQPVIAFEAPGWPRYTYYLATLLEDFIPNIGLRRVPADLWLDCGAGVYISSSARDCIVGEAMLRITPRIGRFLPIWQSADPALAF